MPRRPLRAAAALIASLALLGACSTVVAPPPAPVVTRPASWAAPEVLVPLSAFSGVHGLAIDAKGRLLAGSVLGNTLWEVDRSTGAAKILIDAPEGQADDIAVGPQGELAWTNYLMGMLRYRENDAAPMRVLAKDLPGLNSLDFDRRNGKLYASQVFLGDALWEIDRTGQKPPRLIKKDMGGFNGFEVGPDGMLYGPLWFKGQVVKIDPANGNMTVIADGFKIPAAANLDGKGNLWVADVFGFRQVDVRTGEVRDVFRMQRDPELDYPFAVGLSAKLFALTSWFTGTVQLVDRQTLKTVETIHGLKAPFDALPMADGSVIYAEIATGSITRASGAEVCRQVGARQRLEWPGADGRGPGRRALRHRGRRQAAAHSARCQRAAAHRGRRPGAARGRGANPVGQLHRRRERGPTAGGDRSGHRHPPHRG